MCKVVGYVYILKVASSCGCKTGQNQGKGGEISYSAPTTIPSPGVVIHHTIVMEGKTTSVGDCSG